jgi:hypothetical protein
MGNLSVRAPLAHYHRPHLSDGVCGRDTLQRGDAMRCDATALAALQWRCEVKRTL